MRIFTGYFGKSRSYDKDIIKVSIALSKSRFVKVDEEYKSLAPDWYILKAIKSGGSTQDYYTNFVKLLESRGVSAMLDDIVKISKANGGRDVVLMCYEKLTDFCHRHIVADEFNKLLTEDSKVRELGLSEQEYKKLVEYQKKFWS